MGLRVGADVGCTFTDLVFHDEGSGAFGVIKVLSTPREPWRGVIEALVEAGLDLSLVSVIVHA